MLKVTILRLKADKNAYVNRSLYYLQFLTLKITILQKKAYSLHKENVITKRRMNLDKIYRILFLITQQVSK